MKANYITPRTATIGYEHKFVCCGGFLAKPALSALLENFEEASVEKAFFQGSYLPEKGFCNIHYLRIF